MRVKSLSRLGLVLGALAIATLLAVRPASSLAPTLLFGSYSGGAKAVTTTSAGAMNVSFGTGPVTLDTGLTNSGSNNLVTFGTGQLSSTGKYGISFGASANAGDGARGDLAMAFGWNVSGDGSTPLVASEPSILWRFENYYRPGSGGCNVSGGCVETQMQWLSTDGTVFRPIAFQGNNVGKTNQLDLSATSLIYNSANSATIYAKFTSGGLQLFNSGVLQSEVNNTSFLKQLNAAGNRYNSLLYQTNGDALVLGDGVANGTQALIVYLTDTVQLRYLGGTAPTCSASCGTSPSVSGNNISGRVTMGSSGVPASGWVVTFNGTWTNAPRCSVWMSKTGMVVGKMPIVVATSTTTFTVTTNGTAPSTTDTYDYDCKSS